MDTEGQSSRAALALSAVAILAGECAAAGDEGADEEDEYEEEKASAAPAAAINRAPLTMAPFEGAPNAPGFELRFSSMSVISNMSCASVECLSSVPLRCARSDCAWAAIASLEKPERWVPRCV